MCAKRRLGDTIDELVEEYQLSEKERISFMPGATAKKKRTSCF
jgi:hypothetical protein